MIEYGWLVERTDSGSPLFWTGDSFSADSLNAIRFARERDALTAIRVLLPWDREIRANCLATEHSWG
jgi:hypothetical protein